MNKINRIFILIINTLIVGTAINLVDDKYEIIHFKTSISTEINYTIYTIAVFGAIYISMRLLKKYEK